MEGLTALDIRLRNGFKHLIDNALRFPSFPQNGEMLALFFSPQIDLRSDA